MRLEYSRVPEWPSLAWLAKLEQGNSSVSVQCGERLETNHDWFCEAVWAGEYGSGNFDQSDIVAGSGARARNGELIFVSAGATVDRLVSIELKDVFYVSNSLPCILETINASIDPSYPHYFADLNSIIHGVDKYCRFLRTSVGSLRLTYFENLIWNGKSLQPIPKPFPRRDFSTFEKYRAFMLDSMVLLARNMAAPQRKFPYRMLSTLSSGYDSPTVTTLAREAGCSEAICIDKALHGHDEAGHAIAAVLGVHALRIRRAEWREHLLPEPPFIVGDGLGQDLPFKGAEPLLTGRVLLTGYHGDKVWQKEGGKYLSENMVRGDSSGLSLTEYRLTSGFLHCPVPFWGARQMPELNALSNASDMKRWDIQGTFKDYSRPICRRIVEEAGVPRELFGQRKTAGSVLSDELLNQDSMASYLSWLRTNRAAWLKHGRIPPLGGPSLESWLDRNKLALKRIVLRTPYLWRLARNPPEEDITPSWLRRYIFPWAIELQKGRYHR